MTKVDSKKDPGKFTVRFNLCDPQQRQAAEVLNQQGRAKAQFITNAVLNYIGGRLPTPQAMPPMDGEQLRLLVEDILAQRQDVPQQAPPIGPEAITLEGGDDFNDMERRSIAQTLNAFQSQ